MTTYLSPKQLYAATSMQSWLNANLQLSQMSNYPNTLRLYSLACINSCFILLIS